VCGATLTLLDALRHLLPALPWPPVPWLLLAASGIGVLALLAPRGLPGRWAGLLWCLPAALYRPTVPPAGEFVATVLDVGQGLAVVVRTHAHALVYDSGPRFSARFSAGDGIVLPELVRLGVRRLDLLLLSHGDADHAGAAADLVAGIRTDRVLSGTPWQIVGVGAVGQCREGEAWTWDGVQFELFAPGGDLLAAGDNDHSCLLRVRDAAGHGLQLIGDAQVPAQRQWLRSGAAGPVDVLLAPHHGSRGALHAPLIARLAPREVIFSAGYRSRFGHPHPVVTRAYRAAGARLWNTAEDGAITLRAGAAGLELAAQRARNPRWWRPGAPQTP
jgi:competence protein ComEC